MIFKEKVSGTKAGQYNEGRTCVKYIESIKITCVHAKSLQLCPTLCFPPLPPMDHSPPGSSVHGILLARILEWVVMPPSCHVRASSWPRDPTPVSYSPALTGGFFTTSDPTCSSKLFQKDWAKVSYWAVVGNVKPIFLKLKCELLTLFFVILLKNNITN